MLRKLKKAAMYFLMAIAAYLAIGYLLHLVIFPEKKPEISTYFKPGQEFYSKAEGFRQKVLKQENGQVFCTLELEPFAGGPPKHVHTGFDEFFEVSNGELTLWINGEIKKIRPGQIVHVPRGTPHRPYNETADTIRTKGFIAFPEKFAYHLPQVYGLMDANPDFNSSPKTILHMAVMGTSGFDSYAADGPPVFLQKFTGFMLTPLGRLMGYRSYYPEYDIRDQGRE